MTEKKKKKQHDQEPSNGARKSCKPSGLLRFWNKSYDVNNIFGNCRKFSIDVRYTSEDRVTLPLDIDIWKPLSILEN